MDKLPPLVDKALADTGFDVIESTGNGWIRARNSGNPSGDVQVCTAPEGTLLAVREQGTAERIGLLPAGQPPAGMSSVGLAKSPQSLYQALHLLRTIAAHPASRLSAEVEARLARIPVTERTHEVRKRIGQDVFRDALMDLWGGRCALSGISLPSEMLRASHSKPWARSSDSERLDPFNGLLLEVRFDALFDAGLIAFEDDGHLVISPKIDAAVRQFAGLDKFTRLRELTPGHLPYLRYHREHVAKL
jgi:hypothetical protein